MDQQTSQENENLAQQMFIIGCFGLPWLWFVNCCYFFDAIRSGQASPTLKKWVYCSLVGSTISFAALFIWIITFQLSWRDWSDAKSYMVYVPEEDQNNW